MNPRRSGHHVKVGVAPNSLAMSSTILFSKPSNRSFEYGKLLGSAQTRKVARDPWACEPAGDSSEAPTTSATTVRILTEAIVPPPGKRSPRLGGVISASTGQPARRRWSDRRRRTPYGREKTVSTPPSVVYSASFLYAPTRRALHCLLRGRPRVRCPPSLRYLTGRRRTTCQPAP